MINSRTLILCILTLPVLAQVKPARSPAKTGKASVAKPFTLDRLVSRLADVTKKEYTESALIRRMEKDGIDFTATDANLSRLAHAGASPAFLDVVKHLAPVVHEAPPVIAKVEPTSEIEVSCEPAECQVRIGAAAPISTTGGKLVHKGLKHGAVTVEVTKLGFRPFKTTAMVQGATAEVKAVLQPDTALRQKWGADLKAKVIDSIGGQARLKPATAFFASGDATIWGQDGKKYTSSLEVLIRPPNKAFFRASAGKRSLYEADFLPVFRSKSSVPRGRISRPRLRHAALFEVSALRRNEPPQQTGRSAFCQHRRSCCRRGTSCRNHHGKGYAGPERRRQAPGSSGRCSSR